MSIPKVLLTNPIHPPEQQRLSELTHVVVAPDTSPATLRQLASDCDALVVRSHLPADIFEQAPNLKFVVRHGVGLDMVPLEAATARGIAVANMPGGNTQAVVEYVLAAMFALTRNIVAIDQSLRTDGWQAAKPLSNDCVELGASVLGIVGYGSIGRRLAQIATAIGMSVLAHTRRPQTLDANAQARALPDLLAQSDLIVLACPHTPQTHHLINANALKQMKPSALLINVARGPVVDTSALIQALQAGQLAGAVLDVHEPAVLTGQEPILSVENVLLTPHLAGLTATSMAHLSGAAVDTLLALLAGKQPQNVVNPEVFQRSNPKQG